jgi:hypothetical protein
VLAGDIQLRVDDEASPQVSPRSSLAVAATPFVDPFVGDPDLERRVRGYVPILRVGSWSARVSRPHMRTGAYRVSGPVNG